VAVRRARWSVPLLFVVAFLVAACGPTAPVASPTTSPTEREVAVGCQREAQGGTPVHFDSVDGARLGGLMLGTGAVGIVLVHQIDATLCQWLPYGKRLAERGYRVLLVDLGGYGSSEPSSKPDQDVKQAVGYLRQQGVGSIVLIGASLGGTASLSAAVIAEPPVTGVVSLSGPVHINGMDLSVRIRALASPVLYVAGSDDGTLGTEAQVLYDSTVEPRKQILLVETGAHGVSLVSLPTVSAAVEQRLGTVAPASG
jgi:predicted alpha/beta-hydrolase family hydrolase